MKNEEFILGLLIGVVLGVVLLMLIAFASHMDRCSVCGEVHAISHVTTKSRLSFNVCSKCMYEALKDKLVK